MKKKKPIITEVERKQQLEERQKRIIESFGEGMSMLGGGMLEGNELDKALVDIFNNGKVVRDDFYEGDESFYTSKGVYMPHIIGEYNKSIGTMYGGTSKKKKYFIFKVECKGEEDPDGASYSCNNELQVIYNGSRLYNGPFGYDLKEKLESDEAKKVYDSLEYMVKIYFDYFSDED